MAFSPNDRGEEKANVGVGMYYGTLRSTNGEAVHSRASASNLLQRLGLFYESTLASSRSGLNGHSNVRSSALYVMIRGNYLGERNYKNLRPNKLCMEALNNIVLLFNNEKVVMYAVTTDRTNQYTRLI